MKRLFLLRFLTPYSLLLITVFSFMNPNPLRADDFDIMRMNLRQYVFLGDLYYDETDMDVQKRIDGIVKNAIAYQNSLAKNPTTYLWSDYNKLKDDETYTCKHIYYSLQRLHTMALAWAYPTSSLYQDATLLTDIRNSLNFLYNYALNEKTTLLGNFWEWRIGAPQEYAAIVSILYDKLSPSEFSHFDLSFNNFVRKFAATGNLTYANQADICRNLLYMGILLGKEDDVTSALNNVKRAFVDETTLAQRKTAQALMEQMLRDQGDYHNYKGILKKEGFYQDGTFIQHTAIPYIGGYGESIIAFSAIMQMVFLGCDNHTAPNYFYDVIPTWIDKAYMSSIYKGEMMRMFMGRNVNSAHNSHETARRIGLYIYMSRDLIKNEEDRQRIVNVCATWYRDNQYYTSPYDGMDAIIDKPIISEMLDESDDTANPDCFNLVLAAGDRVIHEAGKYRLGIAMSSCRIGKFEGFSGNNMSGWYTGDGMTYIYTPSNRNHWLNYFNYCNLYRLPGTTVDMITRAADGANIALFDNPPDVPAWAGGISLQCRYGVAGMHLRGAKSDLTARKSWFMFHDEIFCLGAGISMSENREVETIVESRSIAKGWSIDGVAGTTKKCWEETYTNPRYAYINEVGGYYFPQPCTLHTYIEQNKYYSLYFSHGSAPLNATYQYVLLPQMTEEEVASYVRNPQVQALSNTDTIQAVWHKSLGIVGINYWQAGKCASVSCDGEASMMFRHSNDTLYFAASDPTWKRLSLTFVLDGVYTKISASDRVVITYTNKNTTITINTEDRMGQGENIVLKTRVQMPSPDEETKLSELRNRDCKGIKQIENGQIYIYRNNHKYSILGDEL